jgi:hypothetical protein
MHNNHFFTFLNVNELGHFECTSNAGTWKVDNDTFNTLLEVMICYLIATFKTAIRCEVDCCRVVNIDVDYRQYPSSSIFIGFKMP